MTYPHCQSCLDHGPCTSHLQVRFVHTPRVRPGYIATWDAGGRQFAWSDAAYKVWHWPSRRERIRLWRRFEISEPPVGSSTLVGSSPP